MRNAGGYKRFEFCPVACFGIRNVDILANTKYRLWTPP